MNQHLDTALRILRAGGVIAYPTETVYGLGCDPFDEAAVRRVLAIKQRPVEKGLILLAADLEQLDDLVVLDDAQRRQLADVWPAPVTYLLPATERVPAWIRGAHHKVAVRVGPHPVARALARGLGTPLVSTSANRAGRPSARNRFLATRHLGRDVDFVVTGDTDPRARPSAIIDLQSGRVLR
ncbi:L-threonylcarbamoyladenylate synthase [Alloalcanivorax marinus]|uniref:L-threonylcarbamoyladenylate synthase n=1 Tax=Alloalcanivorax marinus TaxID=1177169 RepID=UPI0021D31601|nr:L-threonylcarbamoyladenylate synthase [Alloalcanivorax marinus]MCU5785035.1 Sua5/YciO/YrdC/YwlC family protein [Alloalcanivorax marinus]